MSVMVLVTHDCNHRGDFCKELDDLGVAHEIRYCEEEPELVSKFSIRHSPNLIVGDEVVFRHQPTEQELKQFFNL